MRFLTIAVLFFASLQLATAAELQPRPIAPVPGAPGTPTPTPYPQITPSAVPRAGDARPGAPLLPAIKVPVPPRDQPLPGLTPQDSKAKGKSD
ncbi:hypothetical protein H8F21_20180 [Pseudomonas sp. P66]|jgi:hypothetical protein|uniref:Uncharacterized protein n=2 Tax=Pseudomonas TaxID=286 RepID=A0AB35WRU6_9PSED|nr:MULTISPECIES: hypothetical protein [Pseudomonas]MBM3105177.1 hypothetical protein [Pseudomonas arcuscaelestis]MBM3109234.1 hypothetical protein [Pseudomonas arcuscaelestis]MBM5459885.1 hypothetical protein [Pseudomonas arcuscaelestis]MEE1867323.1 hypothetical protein [Pseudomonas sp. 120P]MEE1958150.1 hypothetical protein [Pseudomonas sp. 119P]